MKTTKLLFAVAALGLGLASCAQDEALSENKGNSISFRPAMGTRATETTNANLSDIKVAAFLGDQTFFEPLDFVKGSDNFFTSTPEYHWPGDDAELSFFAYAPTNLSGVTLTPEAKTLTDFSPAANIADQIDFITSNATGKRSVNEASGVELTFDHRLAQIEIRAKADNEAYTFKISGIRIGQPVAQGNFDFASNEWSLGTSKAIYEETYSSPVILKADAQNVMGSEGNAMLLPQQLVGWDPTGDAANSKAGAYLSVKLQVNTAAGAQVYPFNTNTDCQWAAIPISTNWEPGKKYIYTLDLSHGAGYVDPHDPQPGTPVLGGPIKFTVNVVDWTDTPVALPMTTDKN
ncbi:MAG: fimbrillin family protein [Muribaculaceae bacterium]|nr:fimbrillin family protein [Muribaculaceae bacterium]